MWAVFSSGGSLVKVEVKEGSSTDELTVPTAKTDAIGERTNQGSPTLSTKSVTPVNGVPDLHKERADAQVPIPDATVPSKGKELKEPTNQGKSRGAGIPDPLNSQKAKRRRRNAAKKRKRHKPVKKKGLDAKYDDDLLFE